MLTDRMMPIREAAETLGLSADFIRGEIRAGRLTAYRMGRAIRIAQADLDAYLASRRIGCARPANDNRAAGRVTNHQQAMKSLERFLCAPKTSPRREA